MLLPLGARRLHVALLLWMAVVIAATMAPLQDSVTIPLAGCIVCGRRGLADALLNVALFLPLGLLLSRTSSLSRTVLNAGALSVLIESVQLAIPGRDPSVGDVLFNTLGGFTGFVLAHATLQQLRVGWRATLGPVVVAAGVLGVLGGTGLVLRPALPTSAYYGQWTPNLGGLEWYRGRVRRASLGELELRPHRLDDSRRVRELLLAGARLDVEVAAGPRVPGLAALVRLFDKHEREVVLLGPDRDDLVLRYRTRAAAWTLDQPDLRLVGSLATVTPGDTVRAAAWREAQGYCLALNRLRACDLGFTVGRGWGLLLYPESFPAWLKRALDPAWLAGLLAMVGLAGSARSALLAGGAAIVTGLSLLTAASGLSPSPRTEWAGAFLGLVLGIALRRFLAARVAPT